MVFADSQRTRMSFRNPSRRRFVQGLAAGGIMAGFGAWPVSARAGQGAP
ncbi:MAG: twin-arginine translocation signal domain-containing protein, partial [Arenimonas sp.]